MKNTSQNFRRLFLTIVAGGISLSSTPSYAEMLGKWAYQSNKTNCTIGTGLGAAKLIFLTNADGSSLMLLAPNNQALISVGQKYKLQMLIDGEDPVDVTAEAIQVDGAKALAMGFRATAFANGASNGAALRISLGGKELFDMDKAGSSEAFAAYVACSKKLNAKF